MLVDVNVLSSRVPGTWVRRACWRRSWTTASPVTTCQQCKTRFTCFLILRLKWKDNYTNIRKTSRENQNLLPASVNWIELNIKTKTTYFSHLLTRFKTVYAIIVCVRETRRFKAYKTIFYFTFSVLAIVQVYAELLNILIAKLLVLARLCKKISH